MPHKYYAELLSGERKPITEFVYSVLTLSFGWVHLIRDQEVTIISAGKGN